MNRNAKIVAFIIVDFLTVAVSWLLSFTVLDFPIVSTFVSSWYFFVAAVVITIAVFALFGLYVNLWRYTNVVEVLKIFGAVACVAAGLLVLSVFSDVLSIEWGLVYSFIFVSLTCGCRCVYSFYGYMVKKIRSSSRAKYGTRVIIIGAGDAGAMLLRELQTSEKTSMYPVCILDDDENKIGRYLNGVKIIGKTSEVVKYAELLHVEKIAERCGLPVMLYNAPARCGYDVPLHSVPKCVRWIKDAGKGDRFAKYKGKLLCGDEVNILNFAEAGAVGVVSVLANAAPLLTKRAEQNFLDKNVQKNTHRCENFVTNEEFAPQERQAFFHLSKACFVQKNPIPIKYMLQKLGVFRDCSPRLPLTAATERTRRLCDDALGRFWQYVR